MSIPIVSRDDIQVPVDSDSGCHVGWTRHQGVGEGEEVGADIKPYVVVVTLGQIFQWKQKERTDEEKVVEAGKGHQDLQQDIAGIGLCPQLWCQKVSW